MEMEWNVKGGSIAEVRVGWKDLEQEGRKWRGGERLLGIQYFPSNRSVVYIV
jgi:hypothetical protein